MCLAAYLPPEAKRRAYASNATFKLTLFLSKTCTDDFSGHIDNLLVSGGLLGINEATLPSLHARLSDLE